jgi:hypothetical protein
MGVISARIDDHDEAYLKAHAPNVSEVVRQAVHEKVVRMQRLEALDWLAKNMVDVASRSEDIVREARDG